MPPANRAGSSGTGPLPVRVAKAPRLRRAAARGLSRLMVQTVLGFYAKRMAREGVTSGKTGAVVVVRRASRYRRGPSF